MELDTLRTSGPAMASLLQSLSTNEGDFDGLMFGQYEDIESSIVHDDAPDETTLLRAARITSFASLSSVCSFYNAAGQVEGEKLANLVVGRAQTVLGWFVSRRAVWMTPSLRDRAVCEALPMCLERLQAQSRNRPMLFGLMSAGADKAGATHSFQQKIFQVISVPASAATQPGATAWSSKGIRLSPIRLDISNLGASKQTRSYEALTPVTALPPVALHASQAGTPGEGRKLQESAVQEGHLEQIAASSQQQLESLKAVCSALLAQVNRIGAQLAGKEEEVLELRSRLQSLP